MSIHPFFRWLYKPNPKVTKKGKNSSRIGRQNETHTAERLKTLTWNGNPFHVGTPAGTQKGTDIPTNVAGMNVGWEDKTSGAFEGGCVKLNVVDGKLTVTRDGVIKDLLKGYVPFKGRIPTFLTQRVTYWDNSGFEDEYVYVPRTSISIYYSKQGVHYMHIGGKGIYHTGNDILTLGVPFFEPETQIRIRTSKHKKKGVPTDVTAALHFKKPDPSPYNLFTNLPPSMKVVE